MSVVKLCKENFEKEVIEGGETVFVDFWADWCNPCKMMGPVVEELSNEIGNNAKICKINIDEAQELAQKYQVMSIPTFIVFKNGVESKRSVGVQSKEELKKLF